MSLMEWNAALDVGVEEMNAEHRQILTAMNELYDACDAGTTGVTINALVAKLGRIATEHFAHEENYMRATGYSQLSTHSLIHKNLLEKYAQHAEQIKAEGGVVSSDFFRFLKHWLTAHIQGVDIKYGAGRQAA